MCIRLQDYKTRDGSGGNGIYVCPFANLCNCGVRFRVVKQDSVWRLQIDGKHDADSHAVDNSRGMRLEQRAAVQSVARAHPTSSATQVRRNLGIQEKSVYVSPSKHRQVHRMVKHVRETVFNNFTGGERIENAEGSLTRMSSAIFFSTLVQQHNSGEKHLTLHNPICLGFQYGKNVFFGCYSTLFMLQNVARGIAAGWGLSMGFDSTGPISNTKFDTIGITVNSLGRRANPVCLSFVNQECAIGYQAAYDAVEARLYEVLCNVKLCKRDKACETCDSIRELRENQDVDLVVHPRRSSKKSKPPPPAKDISDQELISAPPQNPDVFQLPLEKAMCDNTTKFSKFIHKRLPHLKGKVLQCSSHLTGIAWQKKLHHKYFKNLNVYRTFYKLLVMATRCSSIALSNVLQRKMIAWLRARNEHMAADWMYEFWTGERGNWTLAHGGVGGTHTNNGTEGRWGGFKSAVAGTAGRSGSLSLKAVVPATMSYLHNVSKEQASYWAADTSKRLNVSTARFMFPVMPRPTPQTWAHVEGMHKWSLEIGVMHGPDAVMDKFNDTVALIREVSPDDSLPLHERITAMYDHCTTVGTACPLPGRNSFSFIIFPRSAYLKAIDPAGTMTLDELIEATEEDSQLYAALMENPAHFELDHPDMT